MLALLWALLAHPRHARTLLDDRMDRFWTNLTRG